MTQSNDGTSGKPGSAHRSVGQPPATIVAGKPADIPMLPPPSAASVVTSAQADQPSVDTEDMQDLLRKIASQIAEAEQRQGAALDGVRSRLNNLAEQTGAAKSEAPTGLQPGLGSIETRIAQMAHAVDTASREIKASDAPDSRVTGTSKPPVASPSMHVRGFGRGQVRGSNEVPASDRAPSGHNPAPSVAPPAIKSSAAAVTATRPPGAADPEAAGPWDQAAADALAKIFRDEEDAQDRGQPAPATRQTLDPSKQPRPEPPALASASAASQPTRSATSPSSAPSAPMASPTPAGLTAGGMTMPPAASARPGNPPSMTATPVGTSPSARTAPPAFATPAVATRPGGSASVGVPLGGGDREWLNARFSEIAAQVERSLKDNRPERVLSVLGQRFDKLETSLATVVTSVRANAEQGSGQAALQSLDTQVTSLKGQVDGIVDRLGGLDAIKADISALSLKLGALERLETTQTQVAALLSGTRSDIDNLARSMSDQKSGGAAALLAGGQAVPDTRIDTLHELVEAHSAERREGEAATVAVLQAIQGAIDQLTGRLEQFEEAVTHTVLAGQEHAAAEPIEPLPGHAQRAGAVAPLHEQVHHEQVHHERVIPSAPAYDPEPPVVAAPPMPSSRGRAPAKAPEAPAAPVEATIPRTRRGLGGISLSGNAIADEPLSRGQRRGKPEPAEASRETMLEAARRSSGADLRDEEADDIEAETIATRLPGQKRAKDKPARGGFFTFEKAGTRPVHVVLLVALLAAGAGMLYGTLSDRTQPMPVHMDRPKSPPGKVGAVQPPIDAPQLAAARQRVGAATGSVQTAERNPSSDPSEALDDGADAEMKASDLNEAALSVLKPSADTEAAALHTSSSLPPAPGESTAISTGILIDSGAPMPSARDLKRFSAEQRMARISSQLGDKAVRKTESERTWPASHTPDAAAPEVRPDAGPVTVAAPVTPAGLPPAQIGPMSLRVAAAKGDPSAAFEVASRFAQGKGIPKDFGKAAEWYQRAASQGSAPAQYRLGGLFERGIGIPADAARARAWYKRAADLGNVKAMHNLAVMYTQRDSGEPDYATASQWFAKAASHGLSDSQFNLAILHENGMGVPKNMAEAYKWYALAAERGDPEAAKRRNAVGGRLATAEVERIRISIAKWRPQVTDPAANDPMVAGQAWRNRHGDDRPGPNASLDAPRPAAAMRATSAAPASQQEAEMIDLSSAAIDAQMKTENAALLGKTATSPSHDMSAAGAASAGDQQQAIMNRKRKVTKVQNPADVEKMLAQFGYNPSALKKARPGGSPDETQPPATRPE